jgi:hypothetical protein
MKIAATMIEEVATSAVTEDGDHLALTLRDSLGNLLTFGFPSDELPHLIDHAAHALNERERMLRPNGDGTGRFAVTWWNLARHNQEGDLVLSFTFGTGGSLGFTLTEHMAALLMETLRCHLVSGAAPRS